MQPNRILGQPGLQSHRNVWIRKGFDVWTNANARCFFTTFVDIERVAMRTMVAMFSRCNEQKM